MRERLRDPFQAKEEKCHWPHCMCLPSQRLHLSAFIAATVALGLPVSVLRSEMEEGTTPASPSQLADGCGCKSSDGGELCFLFKTELLLSAS